MEFMKLVESAFSPFSTQTSPQELFSTDFNLPIEIVETIFTFLTPNDLITIALVSKLFQQISRNTWKSLCEKEFDFRAQKGMNIDWKEYYFQKKSILKPKTLKYETVTSNTVNIPSARMAHTGIEYKNKVMYIGGQVSDTFRLDQVISFDPKSLKFTNPTNCSGSVPKFARHRSVCIGNKIYTYGGYDGHGVYFELAVLDPETNIWSYPTVYGNKPIPRTNHAMTAIGSKIYIYGGNYAKDGKEYTLLGDFYELNVETMTWREIIAKSKTNPGERTAHVLENVGGKIYLCFGGRWKPNPAGWSHKFNDIWMFDPGLICKELFIDIKATELWTKLKTKGDIPVCSFPVHFVLKKWIFFFGGQKIDADHIHNNLFYFDTVTLECVAIPSNMIEGTPPRERDLGPANVIGGSLVVMFGGSSGGPVNFVDFIRYNGM